MQFHHNIDVLVKETQQYLWVTLLIALAACEFANEFSGPSSFATPGVPAFCESAFGEEDLTEKLAFLSTTHGLTLLNQLPHNPGLPSNVTPRAGRSRIYLLKHAFLT